MAALEFLVLSAKNIGCRGLGLVRLTAKDFPLASLASASRMTAAPSTAVAMMEQMLFTISQLTAVPVGRVNSIALLTVRWREEEDRHVVEGSVRLHSVTTGPEVAPATDVFGPKNLCQLITG